MLLARLFEPSPPACPDCSEEICIVAFIGEAAPGQRIPTHISKSASRRLLMESRDQTREHCNQQGHRHQIAAMRDATCHLPLRCVTHVFDA
jgi:hypothetical protein